LQHALYLAVAWIDLASVRQRSQSRIPLRPKYVVQVTIEFEARNNVDVPFPGVINDSLDL